MTQGDTTVRTYVQLAGTNQLMYLTDSYGDVLERINMARGASAGTDNPLSVELVNTRMLVQIPDEDSAVVDACFSPSHVVLMWRAAPGV